MIDPRHQTLSPLAKNLSLNIARPIAKTTGVANTPELTKLTHSVSTTPNIAINTVKLRQAKAVNTKIDQDYWSSRIEAIATQKDREAFAELFDFFAPRIKAFILGKGNGPVTDALAEEIVQDVLLKVWKKADTYKVNQAKVSTWIYTIARNTRIDALRKHNFEECPLDVEDIWEEDVSDETPFHSLQQQRTKQHINEKMKILPDEQRQVLFKSFMEGKSHSEIANDLDISLGTAKSRIRLAMQKLALVVDR